MTVAELVTVAMVSALVGFLSALRWAGTFAALEDVRRLDWLQREAERHDPVATLAIKGYYRRDRKFWMNVCGSVRKAIDQGMRVP